MTEQVDRIHEIDAMMTEQMSPTFCLAKWHQTTIYLHRGETHSCYHPHPHAIPLAELEKDPSVLHNTPEKISQRMEMLVGERPDGCQYCWNVENLGSDYVSDRKIRNAASYKPERLAEIQTKPYDFKVNPEYIEVAFSNECNFKCGYCHPMHSSSFYQEAKKHGPVPKVKNHNVDVSWFEAIEEDSNPYIDAWWKWWPEVSKTLNILRITGGEPLLHKTTWKLFEELKANPRPHLELNMNSNLGMTHRHVEKLVKNINELRDQNAIKKFKLFSSMETWGKRAEYLRTGLNIDTWEKNQDIYVRGTQAHISHMNTYNILTVTSYKEFLQKMLEWRTMYEDVIPDNLGSHEQVRKIRFDSPYLKEPLMYDMHLLPKEDFVPYLDECMQFISDNLDNSDTTKFDDIEFERFRRLKDYFVTTQYDQHRLTEGRIDFYNWFTEYDKRRDTDLLETFPEMESFYRMCENLAQEQDKDIIHRG
jgi:organic radical activating enzyme